MRISGVQIEDTFAEAFAMKAAKVIVTAVNHKWALNAAQAATGFATSIIACQCERQAWGGAFVFHGVQQAPGKTTSEPHRTMRHDLSHHCLL